MKKKLYDQSFHDWKVIPLKLMDNTSDINFIFYSNLDFDDSLLHSIPHLYRTIFQPWKITFLVHLILQTVSNLNLPGSIKMSELLTNLFTLTIFLKKKTKKMKNYQKRV